VRFGRRPKRRDAYLAPPREVFRRLIYKRGVLDGPAGWAFCFLSGLSEWVLAREHRRLWLDAVSMQPTCLAPAATPGRHRVAAAAKRTTEHTAIQHAHGAQKSQTKNLNHAR